MLLPIKEVPLQKEIFPQSWQTVIFRNYGLISTDKIAKTLRCDEKTVVTEAERMGLSAVKYDDRWEKKGFITLIRNNWYLLGYEQLKTLLGFDDARLEFVLEKEDFLHVKLGESKPSCPEVYYSPLTDEERKRTETLAIQISQRLPATVNAFEFFKQEKEEERGESIQGNGENIRIVHGYLTPCGDAFMEDGKEYLPDGLLREYRRQGINGVWVHGNLSSLSYYPIDPELSKDNKIRRKNLQALVERCAKFGIKVYLYVNEPRGVQMEKLGKYACMAGTINNGVAHMCMENAKVRAYLYTAVKDLFEEIKGLGGLITITMSENPTHCNSSGEKACNCPVCKRIPAEKTASDVNNLLMKAVKDSGSDGKVLAYLWGWSSFMGWTEEKIRRGVSMLDKDIIIVCASEYGVKFKTGGVDGQVIDYSISRPGPSETTAISFIEGRKRNIRTCAKIQVNNSWECSAVPYLPVFELVLEHLQNLGKMDVRDYMLTWTLGGYPSPVLRMVADYAENPEEFRLDEWYRTIYGKESERVGAAVKFFCDAFREFPFSLPCLYNSPKTLGPANLWSLQSENKRSTMVCYAFDDYETWIEPYPYEVFVSQYGKLLKGWEQGLEKLRCGETREVKELSAYAEAAYIHFKSDLLQTRFSYLKRNLCDNLSEIESVLGEEEELAERLLALASQYPTIGFEAANHYFYNDRNLVEKILQTQMLKAECCAIREKSNP